MTQNKCYDILNDDNYVIKNMEHLENILSNLDIPKDQSTVYLALLKLGKANYTQLAKETSLKRTTLYLIVEKMSKKGLISQNLAERSMQAVHPRQLFDKLQNNNLVFLHAIPQFEAFMQKIDNVAKVKYYNGRKGIQQLFLDELAYYKNKEEKILRTVAGASFYSVDADFRILYAEQRQEMGIETQMIGSADLMPYLEKYGNQFTNLTTKYLPESIGPITGRISACPSRISLIGFMEDESGIMIESKELADSFIKFFDFTWKLF